MSGIPRFATKKSRISGICGKCIISEISGKLNNPRDLEDKFLGEKFLGEEFLGCKFLGGLDFQICLDFWISGIVQLPGYPGNDGISKYS